VTRIAVVGNGGSGKTWLALRLADVLHVPAIHLDLYRYDSTGAIRTDDVFRREVCDRLTEAPEWVADGNYLSTLRQRLTLADVVIFLDLPVLVCLGGVLARRIRHRGRRIENDTHTDRFDRGFVRYVLSYGREMRPRILASLASSTCSVVHVRTRRQARALVDRVAALGHIPT
jgi:adenylate kinase family enzyme